MKVYCTSKNYNRT